MTLDSLTFNKELIYVIATAFAISYIILTRLRIYRLKKKWNAGDAPYLPGSNILFSRNPVKFLRAKRNGTLLHLLWGFFRDYGENWRVTIAGSVLFVTLNPENIKAVLATQFNEFALGFRNAHFKPLLGDGIFTLDGEGWKHSRALLRPNFSREKIAHVQLLEDHLQRLAKHIRKFKGGKFDIQELFFKFTVDTSTEFLFGQSTYCLMDESIDEYPIVEFDGSRDFYQAFNISQAYLSTRAWFQHVYWLVNPKEFKECNAVVHKFASYYVNKALQATPEENEEKGKDGYIFLYELVKQTRNPKVLQDQLLNIMIAGRDTTAGLMSFAFYELARNPECWERLKEEVYEMFGSGDNAQIDEISFESLKKCTYLKWVINETLRLYPSVPINYRVALKDTTLPHGSGPDGKSPVFIRKGTVIGYLISATHRNPDYYGKDADEFKPERWGDKDLKPGWAYLPFNGGPRICLGQQFAMTEASYVIARIAQMFPNLKSEDTSGVYPPKLSSQLTVNLVDGSWISLS